MEQKKQAQNLEIVQGDKDEIVTPIDIINRQLELEAEAQKILPNDFSKCTYSMGPLNQKVYLCTTCTPLGKDSSQAGICYSCSINCHGQHQLLELFNKRDFTCECGTSKYPIKCSLTSKSETKFRSSITTNTYSQNFENLYCWCSKAYDPDEEEDVMIQCVDCQDWFHEACINSDVDYDFEFICSGCCSKHSILLDYANGNQIIAKPHKLPNDKVDEKVKAPSEALESKENMDIVEEAKSLEGNPSVEESLELPVAKETIESASGEITDTKSEVFLKYSNNTKRGFTETEGTESETALTAETTINPPTKKLGKDDTVGEASSCTWKDKTVKTNLFLTEDWRNLLCRCSGCLERYEEVDMTHLLDPEKEYEPEMDTALGVSSYEAGMNTLTTIPHTQAINIASQLAKVKEKLHAFVKPFAESGEVVTKEDVEKYFSQFKK